MCIDSGLREVTGQPGGADFAGIHGGEDQMCKPCTLVRVCIVVHGRERDEKGGLRESLLDDLKYKLG